MSRKDYQLIAQAICEFSDGNFEEAETERRELAEHFAARLATTNPRFDREKFVQAATTDGTV